MFSQITFHIMEALKTHGPITVFVGVIIESVIIPIPSPLIIMGAGALLIDSGLSFVQAFGPIFLKIVLPGAVASTIGAYFTFFIAYYGGKPVIDKFSGFLGFTWDNLIKLEGKLTNRMSLMIFLLRALPIVPLSLISAAAGVLRVPFIQFTLWTFLGSIPRCLILGYLGYLTRDSFQGLAMSINHMESLSSVAIVAGTMGLILWLRHKVRKTLSS
ncbi:MAG: DedA family protein [Elusimicrobiota bacterium]